MFADCELMGIPYRIVIGNKGLQNNAVKYQHRKADQKQIIALDNIADFVIHLFSSKKQKGAICTFIEVFYAK